MDVPSHPRDITMGLRPIGEHTGPFIEIARTDHERINSSYLLVDTPPGQSQHALRVMISTMSLRGKRYVEVGVLHYRQDRQRLIRYLAALEPKAAQQGIDDAAAIREREAAGDVDPMPTGQAFLDKYSTPDLIGRGE